MAHTTQFVFSQGGMVLARFALDPGEYVIGSAEDCQVVIELEGMEPRHARLRIGEEEVEVEDLGSEVGTFVGGTRLAQRVRLLGEAAVTFGVCPGELRMETAAPAGRGEHRRPRRKRRPRRLAPEDPGWEIWPQAAAPAKEEPSAGEWQQRLEEMARDLAKAREENAALTAAAQKASETVQDNMSLLKVANRALLKKLSRATGPSDEREALRRELKQREKALVEAWAGRQAADERVTHLAKELARLEEGRAEVPVSPLVYLPGYLFWGLVAGVFGMALLGYLLKNSTERARQAEAVVAKVRATAPQFYQDARVLVADGEFQQALAKIDCAIALDSTRPKYFYERGSICESLLMMEPAVTAFENVLKLRSTDRPALKNLELCRSIRATRRGGDSAESQYALHQLMLAEGRLPEALRMAQRLPEDRALLHLTWSAILETAGLRSRLVLNSEGSFDLSLTAQSHVDLALLRGLPLRRLTLARSGITDLSALHGSGLKQLDLSGNPVRDLTPLAGLPLEELNLANTEVTSLYPLSGMPLRELVLDRTPVNDLSPLRGARLQTLRAAGTTVWNLLPLSESPLHVLDLAHTRVNDLTPLHLLPLTELNLDGTPVTELAPLEGLALTALNLSRTGVRSLAPLHQAVLRELWLGGCAKLEGVEPLATQLALEKLTLPLQCRKLEALRALPSLRFIAYDGEGQSVAALKTAREFWASSAHE